MRRMNASKAKKEASEKKVVLNQNIAHANLSLMYMSPKYDKSKSVSSIFFRHPVNNRLIGTVNKVTYNKGQSGALDSCRA
jgi:hypothetical protein